MVKQIVLRNWMNVHAALIFLLIVCVAWGIGRKGLGRVGWRRDQVSGDFTGSLEAFVLGSGLGLGILAYAILGLGAIGALYAGIVAPLLLAALFWCRKELRDLYRAVRALPNRAADPAWKRTPLDPWSAASALLLLGFLSVSFLFALAPETAYDAVLHFLNFARLTAEEHRVRLHPNLWGTNMPYTPVMLYALGLLLSNYLVAKLLNFFFSLLILATLFLWGRRLFQSRTGLFAALLFFSIPVVHWQASTAMIDLGFAAFSILCLYCLWRWYFGAAKVFFWLAAIFLGLSLGSKYFGVFWILPVAWIAADKLLFRDRPSLAKGLGSLAAFFGIALAVVAPWYVKSYVLTGNPVFPLLNSAFRSPYFSQRQHEVQLEEWKRYGLGKGGREFLLLPWNLARRAPRFRGGPGPFFLLFLPLLLFALRSRRLGYILLPGAVYLGAWFATAQEIRYLIPAFAPLALVYAAGLERAVVRKRATWLARTLSVVAFVFVALNFPYVYPKWERAWTYRLNTEWGPVKVAVGVQSEENYLSKEIQSIHTHRYVNERLPQDSYLLAYDGAAFYCHRRFLYPHSLQGSFSYVWKDGEKILEEMKRLGITHVLVNKNEFGPQYPRWFVLIQKRFRDRWLELIYSKNQVDLYKVRYDTRTGEGPENTDNLIRNSGFEVEESPGAPSGWASFGSPVLDCGGDRSRSGHCAVHVDAANGYFYRVKVRPLAFYALSFWARRGVPGTRGRFQIHWTDDRGQLLESHVMSFQPKETYEQHRWTYTSPDRSAWAEIFASSEAKGEWVWLDDYEFRLE